VQIENKYEWSGHIEAELLLPGRAELWFRTPRASWNWGGWASRRFLYLSLGYSNRPLQSVRRVII